MTGDKVTKENMVMAHLSDIEVASKVRMLMRSDLDHEAVCMAGRDRIMYLNQKVEQLQDMVRLNNQIIHDMIVRQQSALIEYRHGDGAESGLAWIEDGLFGPGTLPDYDAEHGTDAEAWYAANCYDGIKAGSKA